MKDFLSNVWVRRVVSVFNLVYFAMITLITFATFMYDLEFAESKEKSFFTVYVGASVVFLVLMIFTRNEFITRLVSVTMLFVVFCMLLFNMYDWILIIPPLVVALVMFFVAGTHETVKVVMGTIYLLMYVLGIVAYFVFNMLFGGTAELTELNADMDRNSEVFKLYKSEYPKICELTEDDHAISPDGKYKIMLYDVQNSDKGGINIVVVPCNKDIELKFFTLKEKGIKKTISNQGLRGVVPDVSWTVDESGTMAVLYRLSPESELKKTTVREMPKKQYLEFLGIS
ncbi:MAG: hypothetical protein IJ129_02445 [Ruminococcus sp.]|nr:hypothetical protein [Ruminococcus sp.]